MKKLNYLILVMVGIILSGCSTLIGTETSYKSWSANQIQAGKGGVMEVFNGIEFWEHGAPEKKFKIIGAITQTKSSRNTLHESVFGSHNKNEIVELIKANMGDGVILIENETFASGSTTETIHPQTTGQLITNISYRETSVLAVIKYIHTEK